jgi:hypothetical protein
MSLPSAAFIAGIGALAVLRIGVGFYGNWHTAQNAHALPLAYDYTSSGVTAGLLYRALGLNGLTWMILTALFVVVATLAPVVSVWRRAVDPSRWRLALLVMVAWQALPSTSQLLGDYQSLLLAFLSLGMVARRTWLWVPMLLLAVLSGPEPAAIGFGCLLIGSLAPPLRRWRTKAVVGLVCALTWFAASSVWLAAAGAYSRRESMLHDVVPTLAINAAQGVLGVYAWWGPWWILVGFMLVVSNRLGRWSLFIGAVAIPGLATALTWDGTRVFVCVSAPIGLAIALAYLRDERASAPMVSRPQQPPLQHTRSALTASIALWLVALILMPPLVSNFGPGFRAQWTGPLYQVSKRLGHPDGVVGTMLGS